MAINIRSATKEDAPFILQMIQALAEFEREPNSVTISLEQLTEDGFGTTPLYTSVILELNQKPVGFALFYNRYSTWQGKTLYLEDLFVIPEARGHGLGMATMKYLAQLAIDTKCVRFEWQVLDWNQAAIDFYTSFSTQLMPEWVNCRLSSDGIKALANLKN